MNTPQLSERAVLVRLSLSCFNVTRTDKQATEEVLLKHLAGKDAGQFKKKLVTKDAIDPIVKHHTAWRQWHYERTLPWGSEGLRILPTIGLLEYNDGTRQRRMKHNTLVTEFKANWAAYKAAAKVALNGLYNEGDYPSDDAVGDKFGVTVEFVPVPSGGDFRIDVAKEIIAEMAESTNSAVAEAQKEAVKDVWQRLANPLLHLADKLRDPKGKFKDSLIGNVLEVAELAPKLNVLGDDRLDKLAAEIRDTFADTKPDELRNNETARAAAKDKADELMARLAGYMA